MAKKKVTFCENHPDIATSDSCEQCGKNICYNCRKIFVNRIFCSSKCVRRFIAGNTKRLIRKSFRRSIWIVSWPFHGLLRIQKWRVLEWALVLGLAFSIYLNIQLKKDLQSLHSVIVPGMEQETIIDTTALPPASIFQPVEGGMVQSNSIDISGEAEDNWIITLTQDSRIIEVQLPKNGKFSFENVHLNRGNNELVVRALNQEGNVYTLQTLSLTYGMPTLKYLVHEIRRGSLHEKQIAFTFDGGADNNAAEEILDYLKEQNIKSTFFLTGQFIKSFPKTVKRIVNEGHEVGNHTLNHPHFTTFEQNRKFNTRQNITKEKVQMELNKTAQLFELVTRKKMAPLWRSPYGEVNSEILQWAAEAGYKHVGWTTGHGWEENMDSLDWVADKNASTYHSASEIAGKILKYADNKKTGANGAIILMHLGTNRKDDFPHQKLPEILNGLKKKGYEMVTVSEMLSRP